MYVVINKHEEVFAGFLRGQIQWSHDWFEAKPLFIQNTTRLLQEHFGAEVIKEEELLK